MYFFFFFFKQKTAYEMRISDWSSDVCSSDLDDGEQQQQVQVEGQQQQNQVRVRPEWRYAAQGGERAGTRQKSRRRQECRKESVHRRALQPPEESPDLTRRR